MTSSKRPLRLVVGIDDVVPKETAQRLIEPALRMEHAVRIVCREGTLERLAADLAVHEIDVVLSDAPLTPTLNVRAYSHHLGTSPITWMSMPAIAGTLKRGFPKSLDGVPLLLPTEDTAIRRAIDQWLAKLDIHALRHTFASRLCRAGVGLVHAQNLLGHSDPRLTAAIYTHLDIEDLRKAVQTMPSTTDSMDRGTATSIS